MSRNSKWFVNGTLPLHSHRWRFKLHLQDWLKCLPIFTLLRMHLKDQRNVKPFLFTTALIAIDKIMRWCRWKWQILSIFLAPWNIFSLDGVTLKCCSFSPNWPIFIPKKVPERSEPVLHFREHLIFANLADSRIYAKIKCSRNLSVLQYIANLPQNAQQSGG